MSINFVSVKCPECGAGLNVEEGRKQLFCSYCGTKIILQNDNEYIHRYVDEAQVKQAEAEKWVKMKQIELEEKKRDDENKKFKFKIKISAILAVIGLFMILFGNFAGELSGNPNSSFYTLAILGYWPIFAVAFIWLASKNKD